MLGLQELNTGHDGITQGSMDLLEREPVARNWIHVVGNEALLGMKRCCEGCVYKFACNYPRQEPEAKPSRQATAEKLSVFYIVASHPRVPTYLLLDAGECLCQPPPNVIREQLPPRRIA